MKEKWFDFVNQLEINDEIKKKLINGNNIESTVNQEKRKMDINIEFNDFFYLDELIQAEEKIGEYFKPYEVRLMPNYIKCDNVDLIEFTKYLNFRLTKEMPFFPSDSLNYVMEKGTIEVLLQSDFHSEVYNKKGILVPTDFFSQEFKNDILNYFKERKEDE